MSLQNSSMDSEKNDIEVLNKTVDTMASAVTTSSPKEPKRFNNIVKSPNDKRDYRGLILNNQMKVLLISDPNTDKSATSLDVNVGYLSDPKEVPGLAHFCEHMLFLGTKKYPEDNDYNQFLSQNGGSSNASTFLDHTNYYFDVNPENLEGALDRFSQFFICPLFTESATEKELNAVHQEHEKNLSNDTWRLDQLDKSSADPEHPYSKFGTGSKETLEIIPKQKSINVREELLKFHKKWYSSNIIALSILGKESLDDLEKLVVEMFSLVENKNAEAPKWTEHPFNEEHFGTKWSVVPIKDIRNLNITFPIPDMHEDFRSGPVHYWSHLLGHEGKGSLLSALKEKGWSNSLIAGKRAQAKGFDFFTIYVDLTEDGLDHVDDIITLVFQYINMIKKEGAVKWIYDEYTDISKMNFRFKEKSSPRVYVNATVQYLQDYPIDEVLTAPVLYTEWKPDLIMSLANYLVPEKIRVHVVAKAFEEKADAVEPWYGTKYKKEKIPKEILAKWENAGLNEAFTLPEKNEFIPTKFDIKTASQIDKFPVIIEDSPFIRLWFKQDDEFLLPRAVLTFDFISPLAYIDPLSTNMTYLYLQLLKDSLNEFAYNADLAGLRWELANSKYGLTLVLSGYDHKLHVLLEKILDRMVNFQIDEKRFHILKENYIRALKNFEADQPYQHASYYLAVLLSEQVWVKNELLNACNMVSIERLQEFIPDLLSKIHIECLFHGNLTKTESLQIARMTETTLTSKIKNLTPLLPNQMVLFREFNLPDGCHFLYEVENKYHKSSCTQVYYQTGVQSTRSNMLLELFTQIISEPCFNILRTKEQLGYIVFSGIRRNNGVQGVRIIIQSNKHPQYVEDKIDEFLDSMESYIEKMSDEEFNKHKESLALQRLEKPKKLSTLSGHYWNEISIQQYNFDRPNVEVAFLRTITRNEILDFYKEFVAKNSEHKHKLSIHVISTADGEKDSEKISESGAAKIQDILQFKTSLPLFPLVKPYNNIPRRGTQQQSKL